MLVVVEAYASQLCTHMNDILNDLHLKIVKRKQNSYTPCEALDDAWAVLLRKHQKNIPSNLK